MNAGTAHFITPATPGRKGGFTLVEILVALAILAIALMAASRAAAMAIGSASHVQQALLADCVARNRLASHKIDRQWPAIGSRSGTEQQAGIDFSWQEEISATPHSRFRRVEIRVFDPSNPDHELRRLTAYVPRTS